MLTATQIAAILSLLVAFKVPQATVDNVSLILTNQAATTMTQDSTAGAPSSSQPSTTAAPATTGTPPVTSAPSDTTTLPTAAPSQAHIDIVSPIPGKGLGRAYVHADQVSDESNYIVLGCVVYDADGNPVQSSTVTATIDNPEGKKSIELDGTGDVMTIWIGDQRRQVPVYTINYEFKVAGMHIFTFNANGLTQSVVLDVK